jgi:hypothetical protein
MGPVAPCGTATTSPCGVTMKAAVHPPLADRIKNGITISENTESQGERQPTYHISDIEMSSSESTWRRDAAEIRSGSSEPRPLDARGEWVETTLGHEPQAPPRLGLARGSWEVDISGPPLMIQPPKLSAAKSGICTSSATRIPRTTSSGAATKRAIGVRARNAPMILSCSPTTHSHQPSESGILRRTKANLTRHVSIRA